MTHTLVQIDDHRKAQEADGSFATHQEFSKKEREDIEFAIQEGIDIIRAVLALGMEKALSGCRVPR